MLSRLSRIVGDVRVEGAGKNGRENYAAMHTARCINNNLAGGEEERKGWRSPSIYPRGASIKEKKRKKRNVEERKVTSRDGGAG